MAISFSPIDTLNGWGQALTTPLGLILLGIVIIYILLRISGRLENPFEGIFGKNKGKGGNSGGGKTNPDYILK